MNKQKVSIFASVTILILLMSVSTVSAGDIFGKITPTTESTKVRCGFGWCKVPTVNDIIIDGDASPVLPSPGTRVYVNVNVRNTFKRPITDVATVTVSGLEGQPIYQEQTYIFRIKANGVAYHVFEIDTNGLPKGDYNVMTTFPIQDGEKNKENNIYDSAFRIVPISIKCIGISKTYNYANEEWVSGDDGICGTSDDDYSKIKYTQNCAAGNSKKSDYLDFTTKCTPPPFDVSVTGTLQSLNATALGITATISHNNEQRLEGQISVNINGVTRNRDISTVQLHKQRTLSFDISDWNPGIYTVTVSFPIKNNEQNTTNNVYKFDIVIPEKPKVVDLHLSQLDGITQVGSRYIKLGEYFGIEYAIVNEGNVDSTGVFTIKTEGITFHTSSITVKKGERKSGMITLLGSQLPYRPQLNGYTYELVGEITTPGDVNPKNNVMHLTLPMKG